MNISEVLRSHARSHPDAAAIIDRYHGSRRVTTYQMLDQQAGCGAAALTRHGVHPGDSVLIFQPMSAELYAALAAVFRVGAVAMFLDPSAGTGHIERCCELRAPAALLASPKAHLLRLKCGALRRIPCKFAIGMRLPGASNWPGNEMSSSADRAPDPGPNTAALITFTSGSTGQPKAALRTHGFLLAQHAILEETLGLERGGRDLTTLPVFALANLASGVTSVIPDVDLRRPGEIDARAVVEQIVRERVTSTAASPAFLERMVEFCESSGQRLPSLRKVFAGGAPVFPPLLERVRSAAPGAETMAVYGSTEAEPICELRAGDIGARDIESMRRGGGLLAGKPIDRIALRVMNQQWGRPVGPCSAEAFELQCVAQGASGEIVVAGAHVLSGYLDGLGDEETKFRVDGRVWHRTGDCGYLDDSGRLWKLGRAAARIEDHHGVLFPFQLECALAFCPGLARSAVISHGGRRVLFLEWNADRGDPHAVEECISWASVDQVRTCPKIPVDRRHNAKIDYTALRRMLDG
jgi:acyl-CoA synthetase (AMP-forming)/AMP-acid ligase II